MQVSPAKPTTQEAVSRERALQRLVTVFICTGLVFLLLPGTFLGVWNLLQISSDRAVHAPSTAWIQAHGQAQIFGWIGTFIIGIGFYSLSKMGRLQPFAIKRGWQSWVLWTLGIGLHWLTGVYAWQWRTMLPLSAALQLAGFLLFFWTVRRHSAKPAASEQRRPMEVWMRVVVAATFAFLAALLWNLAVCLCASFAESTPTLPAPADGHLILISAWGFLVMTVWGFNARWLPVFLGLPHPHPRGLLLAVAVLIAAIVAGLAGAPVVCSVLLIAAAILASWALHVFQPSVQRPKLQGIHPSFPYFIRAAYLWLLVASTLSLFAALFDRNGGISGASRHALAVGFLATMVFSIGPRILPAFCGMRVLFSKNLMFAALALLNLGCVLRVCCEIQAYEHNVALAWQLLPVSAYLEFTAVGLFVLNLALTFLRPPAHLLA
ncbi:MAG: NnrS family protein, partial [Bryobacteraceae bacterium]